MSDWPFMHSAVKKLVQTLLKGGGESLALNHTVRKGEFNTQFNSTIWAPVNSSRSAPNQHAHTFYE